MFKEKVLEYDDGDIEFNVEVDYKVYLESGDVKLNYWKARNKFTNKEIFITEVNISQKIEDMVNEFIEEERNRY